MTFGDEPPHHRRVTRLCYRGPSPIDAMPVEISEAKREYTVEYRHTSGDVSDVRVAFLFGDQDQAILLDRIALRGYRE